MNTCPTCGKPYGERKRCYYCHGRPKTGEDRACLQCGATFYVSGWQIRDERGNNQGRYCSKACKDAALKLRSTGGAKPFLHSSGYVLVFAPEHPRATRGRVFEHILVAERMLGRPLAANERVHHKDHDRTNNDPANLEVLTNRAHSTIHARLKSERARANAVYNVCAECGKEYRVAPYRKDSSKHCSNACRLVALHRGNRRDERKE